MDEARAIVRQAQLGHLEVHDPQVARVVGEANRVLTRADTWGAERTPRERRVRRFVVVGSVVFLLAWIAGLLLPLLALAE